MDASTRRNAVLRALTEADGPVSASTLAAQFSVSRQIIVGDVALLRAAGEAISATPRGYVLERAAEGIRRTVACRPRSEGTEREVNSICDAAMEEARAEAEKLYSNPVVEDTAALESAIENMEAVLSNSGRLEEQEHAVYGQLTGQLQIRSRYDVAQFMERLISDGAKPLSSLTDGIHLHTLLCPDEAAFRRTREALRAEGFLLE